MSQPDYTPEELQSILWDILHECVNGRPEGHHCPFCREGTLACTVVEDVSVKMECGKCGKYIDTKIQ